MGSPSVSLRSQPVTYYQAFADWCEISTFTAASCLTEPTCKPRELYYRLKVLDKLEPELQGIRKLVYKFFICLQIGGYALLAVLTTLPGILLRYAGAKFQSNPFIALEGDLTKAKPIVAGGQFSLLSWNICCPAAGYSVSDGGVTHWTTEISEGSNRVDYVVREIDKRNADVVCLYELMDFHTSLQLYDRLKINYPYFYLNIGPKAIGPNSGIFVASKYAIANPEFIPFTQAELHGRASWAAKGAFRFDLQLTNRATFATIFTTHLQHSEIPARPEIGEQFARKQAMNRIARKVDDIKNRCVVLTGDLNLDDNEYNESYSFGWRQSFTKGDQFGPLHKTWGGDAWCAALMYKTPSPASNLDHTMLKYGSARGIATQLTDTGYDERELKRDALSDHRGLYTVITL